MVDDYTWYKALFRPEDDDAPVITEAGCLAHVRRKFVDLFKMNGSPRAAEALVYIGYLYDLEQVIRDRSADQKRRWRRRYAKLLLKEFHEWLTEKEGRAGARAAQGHHVCTEAVAVAAELPGRRLRAAGQQPVRAGDTSGGDGA